MARALTSAERARNYRQRNPERYRAYSRASNTKRKQERAAKRTAKAWRQLAWAIRRSVRRYPADWIAVPGTALYARRWG